MTDERKAEIQKLIDSDDSICDYCQFGDADFPLMVCNLVSCEEAGK